jgi:hypothetical protein
MVAVALLSACSLLAPSDEELAGGNAGGSSSATASASGAGGSSGATSSSGASGMSSGSGSSSSTGGGTPIPMDAMLLWLSADSGVELQNGRVASWRDRSGSGNDAASTTLDEQPAFAAGALNGLPAIDFDGVDDHFDLPPGFSDFSKGLSLFTVVERRMGGGQSCPPILQLSNDPEVNDISLQLESADTLLYEVQDSTVSTKAGAYLEGVPKLLSVIHSPQKLVDLIIDGQPWASYEIPLPATVERSQNAIAKGLYGGCTNHSGLIAEVILYARALAPAEQSVVREYLQTKWGCCR